MKVLTIFKSNTHKEKTALSKFVASELIRSSNKDFNNLHTNKVVEILVNKLSHKDLDLIILNMIIKQQN